MWSQNRFLVWSARIVLFALPVVVVFAGAAAHWWHLYAALPWLALGLLLTLPWLIRAIRNRRSQPEAGRDREHGSAGATTST